jgi:OmcA/MtrC family decaheme c-type cytochrome
MRRRYSIARFLLGFIGLGIIITDGAEKSSYKPGEKAFYLTEAQIAFIRSGLKLQIQKVEFSPPKVNVTFRIADDQDQGLDRLGIDTAGPINIGYTLARIKPGDQQYTSYYVAPPTGITQPRDFTDQGGTYQPLGNGTYKYTMGLQLPANFEANSTHTLGMWASRNLSDFGLGVPNANAVFDFVPSGAQVTQVRDIVSTQACNQCHDPLAAHGQPPYEFDRREVRICILCHYAGQINPESGNTVDERVFIHKLHMGANLPSVTGQPLNIFGTNGSTLSTLVATGATQNPIPAGYDPAKVPGQTYQIPVTSENEKFDASTIIFPQDVRNCTTCHQKAAQADNWKTNPSRAACGSCHDDVNFDTGKNHLAGAQPDDKLCSGCHPADGQEFDFSVAGSHTLLTKSKQLAGLNVQIVQVTNANPGGNPQVSFTVTDNKGNRVDASMLDRLMLTIAGPTSDYATDPPWQEDARKAAPGLSGYTYTLARALPKEAGGTWAVGAEAFRVATIPGPSSLPSLLGPGRTLSVRESAFNPVFYFSVDGSQVAPRRTVVDLNSCNSCHKTLAIHGGVRQNTEYCVLCHNPNHGDGQTPPETVNFPTMIHRIHMGVVLESTYSAGGTTGLNFNGVRFPGDPRNCSKCHVGTTNTIPLPDGLIPTIAARFFYSPLQPTAAACLGCHNALHAAAHAFAQTTVFGESCEVCHAEGADFAVSKVHARREAWPPEDAQ